MYIPRFLRIIAIITCALFSITTIANAAPDVGGKNVLMADATDLAPRPLAEVLGSSGTFLDQNNVSSSEVGQGSRDVIISPITPKQVKGVQDTTIHDTTYVEDRGLHYSRLLDQVKRTPNVKELVDLSNDADHRVRVAIIERMGEVGDKSAVPFLIKALKDDKFAIREAASEALQLMNEYTDERKAIKLAYGGSVKEVVLLGEIAVPHLIEVMRRGRYFNVEAAEALSKIGGEKAKVALIEALNDANYREIKVVIKALANMSETRAVPALTTLLRYKGDDQRNIRIAARDALKQLKAYTASEWFVRNWTLHNWMSSLLGIAGVVVALSSLGVVSTLFMIIAGMNVVYLIVVNLIAGITYAHAKRLAAFIHAECTKNVNTFLAREKLRHDREMEKYHGSANEQVNDERITVKRENKTGKDRPSSGTLKIVAWPILAVSIWDSIDSLANSTSGNVVLIIGAAFLMGGVFAVRQLTDRVAIKSALSTVLEASKNKDFGLLMIAFQNILQLNSRQMRKVYLKLKVKDPVISGKLLKFLEKNSPSRRWVKKESARSLKNAGNVPEVNKNRAGTLKIVWPVIFVGGIPLIAAVFKGLPQDASIEILFAVSFVVGSVILVLINKISDRRKNNNLRDMSNAEKDRSQGPILKVIVWPVILAGVLPLLATTAYTGLSREMVLFGVSVVVASVIMVLFNKRSERRKNNNIRDAAKVVEPASTDAQVQDVVQAQEKNNVVKDDLSKKVAEWLEKLEDNAHDVNVLFSGMRQGEKPGYEVVGTRAKELFSIVFVNAPQADKRVKKVIERILSAYMDALLNNDNISCRKASDDFYLIADINDAVKVRAFTYRISFNERKIEELKALIIPESKIAELRKYPMDDDEYATYSDALGKNTNINADITILEYQIAQDKKDIDRLKHDSELGSPLNLAYLSSLAYDYSVAPEKRINANKALDVLAKNSDVDTVRSIIEARLNAINARRETIKSQLGYGADKMRGCWRFSQTEAFASLVGTMDDRYLFSTDSDHSELELETLEFARMVYDKKLAGIADKPVEKAVGQTSSGKVKKMRKTIRDAYCDRNYEQLFAFAVDPKVEKKMRRDANQALRLLIELNPRLAGPINDDGLTSVRVFLTWARFQLENVKKLICELEARKQSGQNWGPWTGEWTKVKMDDEKYLQEMYRQRDLWKLEIEFLEIQEAYYYESMERNYVSNASASSGTLMTVAWPVAVLGLLLILASISAQALVIGAVIMTVAVITNVTIKAVVKYFSGRYSSAKDRHLVVILGSIMTAVLFLVTLFHSPKANAQESTDAFGPPQSRALAVILTNKGKMLEAQGINGFGSVIDFYKRAIEADSTYAEPYDRLLRYYVSRENLKKASEYCIYAMQHDVSREMYAEHVDMAFTIVVNLLAWYRNTVVADDFVKALKEVNAASPYATEKQTRKIEKSAEIISMFRGDRIKKARDEGASDLNQREKASAKPLMVIAWPIIAYAALSFLPLSLSPDQMGMVFFFLCLAGSGLSLYLLKRFTDRSMMKFMLGHILMALVKQDEILLTAVFLQVPELSLQQKKILYRELSEKSPKTARQLLSFLDSRYPKGRKTETRQWIDDELLSISADKEIKKITRSARNQNTLQNGKDGIFSRNLNLVVWPIAIMSLIGFLTFFAGSKVQAQDVQFPSVDLTGRQRAEWLVDRAIEEKSRAGGLLAITSVQDLLDKAIEADSTYTPAYKTQMEYLSRRGEYKAAAEYCIKGMRQESVPERYAYYVSYLSGLIGNILYWNRDVDFVRDLVKEAEAINDGNEYATEKEKDRIESYKKILDYYQNYLGTGSKKGAAKNDVLQSGLIPGIVTAVMGLVLLSGTNDFYANVTILALLLVAFLLVFVFIPIGAKALWNKIKSGQEYRKFMRDVRFINNHHALEVLVTEHRLETKVVRQNWMSREYEMTNFQKEITKVYDRLLRTHRYMLARDFKWTKGRVKIAADFRRDDLQNVRENVAILLSTYGTQEHLPVLEEMMAYPSSSTRVVKAADRAIDQILKREYLKEKKILREKVTGRQRSSFMTRKLLPTFALLGIGIVFLVALGAVMAVVGVLWGISKMRKGSSDFNVSRRIEDRSFVRELLSREYGEDENKLTTDIVYRWSKNKEWTDVRLRIAFKERDNADPLVRLNVAILLGTFGKRQHIYYLQQMIAQELKNIKSVESDRVLDRATAAIKEIEAREPAVNKRSNIINVTRQIKKGFNAALTPFRYIKRIFYDGRDGNRMTANDLKYVAAIIMSMLIAAQLDANIALQSVIFYTALVAAFFAAYEKRIRIPIEQGVINAMMAVIRYLGGKVRRLMQAPEHRSAIIDDGTNKTGAAEFNVYFDEGMRALDKDDWYKAIFNFNQACLIPDEKFAAELHFNLAEAWRIKLFKNEIDEYLYEDIEEIVTHYLYAIKFAGDKKGIAVDACNQIAALACRFADFDTAEKYISKAKELRENDAVTNQIEEKVDRERSYLELFPNSTIDQVMYANIALFTEQYAEAVKRFENIPLDTIKDNSEALMYFARAYEGVQKYERALAMADRALELSVEGTLRQEIEDIRQQMEDRIANRPEKDDTDMDVSKNHLLRKNSDNYLIREEIGELRKQLAEIDKIIAGFDNYILHYQASPQQELTQDEERSLLRLYDGRQNYLAMRKALLGKIEIEESDKIAMVKDGKIILSAVAEGQPLLKEGVEIHEYLHIKLERKYDVMVQDVIATTIEGRFYLVRGFALDIQEQQPLGTHLQSMIDYLIKKENPIYADTVRRLLTVMKNQTGSSLEKQISVVKDLVEKRYGKAIKINMEDIVKRVLSYENEVFKIDVDDTLAQFEQIILDSTMNVLAKDDDIPTPRQKAVIIDGRDFDWAEDLDVGVIDEILKQPRRELYIIKSGEKGPMLSKIVVKGNKVVESDESAIEVANIDEAVKFAATQGNDVAVISSNRREMVRVSDENVLLFSTSELKKSMFKDLPLETVLVPFAFKFGPEELRKSELGGLYRFFTKRGKLFEVNLDFIDKLGIDNAERFTRIMTSLRGAIGEVVKQRMMSTAA
jgi:hypothetical protein